MNFSILFALAALAAVADGCGVCDFYTGATCEDNPTTPGCDCTVQLGNEKKVLNCKKPIPKCFLMKSEFGKDKSSRGFKNLPDHAYVDNDGIYNPECENDGTFKAKQCNGTEECWCVNSAGVRRSDRGSKEDVKCEKLVETSWIQFQLTHKDLNGAKVTEKDVLAAFQSLVQSRYKFEGKLADEIQYDEKSKVIKINVNRTAATDPSSSVATMAYYLEKDVKQQSLMNDQAFSFKVGNQVVEFEKILVYYVDSEPPTFTMQYLSGGIIAVIVVVVLVVVLGLIALFLYGRRQKQRYRKTQMGEGGH